MFRVSSGWGKEGMRTAIVGFGNPFHGDDGIGPVVARRLYESLLDRSDVELLEVCASDFGLMERLIGYERAIIIDALVAPGARVGDVERLAIREVSPASYCTFHAAGLGAALVLARRLGLAVPAQIALYGIAIPEPPSFGDRLSPALESRLPEIVAAIARAEFA